jgi:serine-type D-Ala-D-Ala carboxypeptidase/endopeptidase (penicillin-binding protein 4)
MLAWGAVALLLAVAPAAAGAQPASPTRALKSALRSGMRHIGGASSAYVVDMTTGQTLFARNANVGRMPASVEKIYTTSTALLEFGPQATLTTSVLGVGSIDATGIWHGTLYLKGGGDPTFGSVNFDQAAYGTGATMRQLVSSLLLATHITGVQGQIVGDGSYFDQRRGTPATGFATDLPDVEGELGALVFNRGFANPMGAPQSHPVLYAAQRFIAALRLAGVDVPAGTAIYGGPTPPSAQLLATISSPPMATLIQLTNTPSDNFFAEMLLKGLGARFGAAGTTAAGAGVVRSELATKFGITPQLDDGSGLSRTDSTSPRQVVTVLEQMYSDPDFFNSLAIGGETGTLHDEMLRTAARGACHGKTGTLHDVANLAGYCRARDGHELAFAFLANGIGSPYYVHYIEGSKMAAALAKYDG